MKNRLPPRHRYVVSVSLCCLLMAGILLGGCSGETEDRYYPDPVPELEWNRADGYRWAELPLSEDGQTGFTKVASSVTGVTFSNLVSDDHIADNRVLLNGSGVTAADVTGNGYADLYFTSLTGENKLYENKGNFEFTDITDEAGVAHSGFKSTGALFADVNGNGYPDLLISSLDKRNSLYLNDGKGRFELKENSGLGAAKGSSTMAMADISGNGYPDLYITNYKEKSPKDILDFQDVTPDQITQDGQIVSPYNEYYTLLNAEDDSPDVREIGEKDALYLNNGDGTFTEVTNYEERFLDQNGNPSGLFPDWGLTAKFQDLNGNGLQDLYVANDFWTPDRIWMNRGDGTFRAMDTLAIRNSSYSAMAVDFSDVDRDGNQDIFVVEMLSPYHEYRMRQMNPDEPLPLVPGDHQNRPRYNRNSFYMNRGDQTYSEISYYSGLEASDWSWAVRFIDLNLNGYEDVIISTGFAYDLQDMDAQLNVSENVSRGDISFDRYILGFPALNQQNKIFRNNGDLTFSEMSSEWGFTNEDISHGMIVADLNHNGVLDVVMNRFNEEAAIYQNRANRDRIAVRLKGSLPNTQAAGAKVKLTGGPVENQVKQLSLGGDYVSGSDLLTVFAADGENQNHQLTITWPDGSSNQLNNLKPNRIYEVFQDEFRPEEPEENRFSKSEYEVHFSDQSALLNHSHHEDSFDDFQIQPLLPYKLSHTGPGVAWIDITQDGSDELLIGTGKGAGLSAFQFDETGHPSPIQLGTLSGESSGDQTGIIGWTQNGQTHLVVGLANYEIGTAQSPSALYVHLKDGEIDSADRIPGILSTTGPVAAADYSGNGQPDLFVGGRFIPGRYPENATSRLFLNQNGSMVPDIQNADIFEEIGLVTGALFVDYNLNGQQDMILSTEWGTLRLFENKDGKFTEITEDVGLDRYSGWWQGVTVGDFTGDGYPDLVATNLGLNTSYQIQNSEYPLKLFYGDFNNNGTLDIIDSYYDERTGGYVPRRQLQEYQSVADAFGNIRYHRLFGRSTVDELLGMDTDRISSKKINTLEHMVFINREGKEFEAAPLPKKAQLSASFHAGVADLDNSGHEDIFMSQNFFAVPNPQQKPRIDGGRGIWLKGDGTGNFEALPGHESGIIAYGEQRGAGFSDITKNGRTDMVLTQNAAETKLFRNETVDEGLVVQLEGPDENQLGIGSSVRIIYQDGTKGPNRFIQAGTGYLSQNSAVHVLGISGAPQYLEVTWMDGKKEKVQMEEDLRPLTITY